MAVGVDAHRGQVGHPLFSSSTSHTMSSVRYHGLQSRRTPAPPVRGEAQPAGCQGLLPGGLVLQPQVVGVDGALVAVMAQAEYTRAVTAVGKVHVERASLLIGMVIMVCTLLINSTNGGLGRGHPPSGDAEETVSRSPDVIRLASSGDAPSWATVSASARAWWNRTAGPGRLGAM